MNKAAEKETVTSNDETKSFSEQAGVIQELGRHSESPSQKSQNAGSGSSKVSIIITGGEIYGP